jgi:hypothetical protein
MNSTSALSHPGMKEKIPPAFDIRLKGAARTLALLAWSLITLASLVSFGLSVYSLNVWDQVPAAQQSRYFPDLTAQVVDSHTRYQDEVLNAGFSLAGYALFFTVARLLGGLALFVVGFLLLRRYNDRLMAVLMAILLSVFAAAGIWSNTLFSWGVALAAWLQYPAALLGWLLWCGLINLYAFPDGRFTPRWTVWLAVLIVPLTFFMAFQIHLFLNPEDWPNPLDLSPNLLFIGTGFFAILYRYGRTFNSLWKRRMRPYVLSLSLLMAAYFIDFLINEVYYRLAGQALFQGYQAGMGYVMVYEPVWYILQIGFAVGLGISVFQRKLLEG